VLLLPVLACEDRPSKAGSAGRLHSGPGPSMEPKSGSTLSSRMLADCNGWATKQQCSPIGSTNHRTTQKGYLNWMWRL
jgi:hypothetical protein